MNVKPEIIFHRELQIEDFLRKHPFILGFVSIITSALLYIGIDVCMINYTVGYYWIIVLSGLFAHAFFVISMHDGAHQSLTQSPVDRLIMNTCSGLIILPIYTELFRKFHLLHHAHTNTELDPLWASNKRILFEKHRYLYAFLQCLPFVLNFYMLLTRTKKEKQAYPFQPKVSIGMILWSIIVSFLVIYFIQPPVFFVLGTFAVMTSIGAIRYWGEHMGIKEGKESNTHWFPLGMGIGNHDAHHYYPNLSWLTLTIGSWYRKKDTNPLKTVYRIFFDKRFHHYKAREN